MAADFKFTMDGKPATLAQAEKATALAVDTRGRETNVVHGFSTQTAYRAWAKRSKCLEEISQLDKLAARARKHGGADNQAAMKRQKANAARIARDLEELAAKTGLSVGSTKLFRLATRESDPLDGPIFDPHIFYEHINRGGRFLPMNSGRAYPDFTWLGFNDIASSITTTSNIKFWVDVWFSGRSLTFVGIVWPPVTLNFTALGFNDVISSAVSYL
jgi:hypothetical protein